MLSTKESNPGVYYFLGNITSHIIHALPLYKRIGGTFVVVSGKAKDELEKYNIPVISLDDVPFQLQRSGRKIKPIYHYLALTKRHSKTIDFLNNNAKVVIFYELYDFDNSVKLDKPKKVFLTHGNMLKNYMTGNNRLKIIEKYDYMAALGPYMKQKFIDSGIASSKLINLGIARTDEIIQGRGKISVPASFTTELSIDPKKPIVSYMPTYWGASSIYTTGIEIVKNFPESFTLIFRPHPQTPKKLLKRYLRIIKDRENIVYAPEGRFMHAGLVEILDASSVIIGDVSSVMLEAILTDKPLIFAYDTDEHKQLEAEYESISEIVSCCQSITLNNVKRMEDILTVSLHRSINSALWDSIKSKVFFHYKGDSIETIEKFIKGLL